MRELYKRRSEADAVTAIHHHAVFAEDALRIIADKIRAQFPTATQVTCQIVNYESIFEYPSAVSSSSDEMLMKEKNWPELACFVAEDVDAAWDELGPHLLHDARTYAQWNPGNDTSAHISRADTIDDLRATSQSHKIFSIPEAADLVRNGTMLNLAPLCGGIPPAIASRYLECIHDVADGVGPDSPADTTEGDLGSALQQLTSCPAN